MFDTGLRKNIKKKSRRDGQIGKYKLNEMGALKMKQKMWEKKLDKSKRYSYNSIVFKHGSTLETYLKFWQNKK